MASLPTVVADYPILLWLTSTLVETLTVSLIPWLVARLLALIGHSFHHLLAFLRCNRLAIRSIVSWFATTKTSCCRRSVCGINLINCWWRCRIVAPLLEVLWPFLSDKRSLVFFFALVRLRRHERCFHSPAIAFVILLLPHVLPQQRNGSFERMILSCSL